MILIREMTPGTMRLGTVISSVRTPSTRIRTRSSESARPLSSDLGSKWMSDAPRSAASAMIEWTNLMTGASSADSRRSTTSSGAAPSSPSSTASCTASSNLFIREIRFWMSSAAATAGLTSRWVSSEMSSAASTLAGSDIASTRVCSSRYATGTAL